MLEVRELASRDRVQAVRMMVDAFVDSPLWLATGPANERYRRGALWLFFMVEMYVARRRGGWLLAAYDGDRVAGLLVAIPDGTTPVPLTAWPVRVLPGFFVGPLPAFRTVRISNELDRRQPKEPHTHCWLLGADSTTRGVGALLLQAVCERAAPLNRDVYLEAATRERAELFGVLGWREIGRYRLRNGNEMTFMIRPAEEVRRAADRRRRARPAVAA
jgi:hypothetical protein